MSARIFQVHSKLFTNTTEGGTAKGAFGAYKKNRSDPHFTVDDQKIYQHIDTALSARSLRNPSGGVQTNRDSALQIEVVGSLIFERKLKP